MAVAERGEVKVGTYTLVLDINALCEAEAALGVRIPELLMLDRELGFTEARALLWAGLQPHHPEVSLPDCGDLIGVHGYAAVLALISQAIRAAYPEPSAEGKVARGRRKPTGSPS